MTTPRFRQSLIRALFSGLTLFVAACQTKQPAPAARLRLPLLPQAASIEPGEGSFTLDAASVIRVPGNDPEARRIGDLLAGYLQQTRGLRPAVETADGATAHPAIVLAIDSQAASPGVEGYELTVSPQQIRIAARAPAGLFYGAATAWQLLTPEEPADAPITVPAVHIVDQPRFAWRGLMLDVSRHYMPPEFIEQLLDWMALHKLNTFHWHLTDDQGWRLEIKKYPLLTQVGAWRQEPDGSGRYGGYYTQDQVRQIVRYAAERYIAVVPEIDMPGHMQAAIAAYPWLGSRGDHPPVSADWGVHPYLLNVDERTFGFVEDVLTEVMALFPGRYIHIGGDEAIKDQWQASAQVQKRMHELGVADENALQGWFAQRLETFLQHGRKLVGWDEIVGAGLPADATVMSWRGTQGAIAASRAGHDVVMSPYQSLYLDYLQGAGHDEPPGRPEPLITLKDVYDFQPVPAELDAAQAAHVIGLQANVWTEHIIDPAQVEHAAFPRLAALAEVAWSPAASHDWHGFLQRLLPQLARYRALHIGYADSAFAVQIEAQPAPGGATVTLGTQTGLGEIRYTLDGRQPDTASPRYQAALNVPLPVRVRAAAFVDGRAIAPPAALDLDAAALLHRNSDQLAACSDKLPLRLGGQLQPDGRQAVYRVDIMDPCWIYRAAPLDGVSRIDLRVAALPFNFQLGHDAQKVVTHPMWSLYGELEVHLDACSGPLLAAMRLPKHTPGQPPQALSARLKPQSGSHDLCFLLAAPRDPLWALDSVQLSGEQAAE